MAPETIKKLSCRAVADLFPRDLLERLAAVHKTMPGDVYLTGGTVRDLLLTRRPADIDLTVVRRAKLWARQLAELTGGTYVELGRDEDAARVVWQGVDVDFSSFREGASSIDEELHKRDITVNSLAVGIHDMLSDPEGMAHADLALIDPVGGCRDLEQRLIKFTSKDSIRSDPLRMLRLFRFAAVLDFDVDPDGLQQVHLHRHEIERVSPERVAHELDLIMASERGHQSLSLMRDCGLLWVILPELRAGVGMDQPSSHHLDVFEHSLETLHQMEMILADPAQYFPDSCEVMEKYLQPERRSVRLKWAALRP